MMYDHHRAVFRFSPVICGNGNSVLSCDQTQNPLMINSRPIIMITTGPEVCQAPIMQIMAGTYKEAYLEGS